MADNDAPVIPVQKTCKGCGAETLTSTQKPRYRLDVCPCGYEAIEQTIVNEPEGYEWFSINNALRLQPQPPPRPKRKRSKR